MQLEVGVPARAARRVIHLDPVTILLEADDGPIEECSEAGVLDHLRIGSLEKRLDRHRDRHVARAGDRLLCKLLQYIEILNGRSAHRRLDRVPPRP
jgi:hypothetical protein